MMGALIVGIGASWLVGCGALLGNDDGNGAVDDCPFTCLGTGSIAAVTNGSTSISFPAEAKEQKHILIPFVLGSLDTINGAAETEDPKVFTITKAEGRTAQAGSGGETESSLTSPLDQATLAAERAHNLRTLWNRFRSSRGLEQTAGFWRAVRAFDRQSLKLSEQADPYGLSMDAEEPSLEQTFRRMIHKRARNDIEDNNRRGARLTEGNCPANIYVIDAEGYEDPINPNYVNLYDEGTFCLAIIKEEKLVSETDLKRIKSNIQETLGNYQLIYPKLATATAADYTWKPLIVIAPFDDPEVWPAGDRYKLQGAFVAEVSELQERPTLFVPADFTKVGVDADKAQESFHAAIVHELHHAVTNFFRVWVAKGEDEFVAIDEGLAHYAEDLLGYGQLNFPLFANLFLATFVVAPSPILYNPSSVELDATGRGAAQAFWYYLVSSKGGVSFKDGTVDTDLTASPGLEILRTFVEGNTTGTKGIQAAHGGNWVDVVGGFLGALVVDGTPLEVTATNFKVQDPVDAVADTSGEKNKIFGMKYNAFGDLADISDELPQYKKLSAYLGKEQSVKFYTPSPFLYAVEDTDQVLEVNFGESYTNAAVVVVRVE